MQDRVSTRTDNLLKAFISYSRKDLAAAERLRDRLIAEGFDAYLDRHDILPGEPWRERLGRLIESADTVIFLVSPDAVTSEICDWEVNEAERLDKRILPVIVRDAAADVIPGRLRRLNYIFLRDPAEEETGLRQLSGALLTDIAWVREHTRLGELAAEWDRGGRRPELLLRGAALAAAELWISQQHGGDQGPTDLHRAFISASRADEQARADAERVQIARTRRLQRRAGWALAGVALLVVAGLIAGAIQTREVQRREIIVLTSLAHRAIQDGLYTRAMRIAAQGLPASDPLPIFSLGWDVPEVRGLEAKLAGAAQLSALLVQFNGHQDRVRSAAFSRDGTRIVTASADGTARIWDASTGQELVRLQGHTDQVETAAFSPDGERVVTASLDGTARIWNARTGEPLRQLAHRAGVGSAAYSPDGRSIVTISDSQARLWDAASGREPRSIGERMAISAVFSPDGSRVLIGAMDRTAHLLDVRTGTRLSRIGLHDDVVSDARFSRDGARILTVSNKTIRLFNGNGTFQFGFSHSDTLLSAEFSPDGKRIVTASVDRTARVWDAINNRTAHAWDSAARQELVKFDEHFGVVRTAVFSPDGTQILTASYDGKVRLWRARAAGPVMGLDHGGFIERAEFSPDDRRILTARNVVLLFDAKTGRRIAEYGHDVVTAAYSPDGGRIAAVLTRETQLLNAETGDTLLSVPSAFCICRSAGGLFSPEGARFAAPFGDKEARIWDVSNGRPLATLTGHAASVDSPAFSPDGARIVTASGDRTARIWDAATGQQLIVLEGHTASVNTASFSADGSRVVTAANDRTARIWDARNGETRHILGGHGSFVHGAAFSRDGERVVTASADTTARVWDVESGQELMTLRGHANQVLSALFSNDGTRIVTASSDKTAQVWDAEWLVNLRGPELVRRACADKLVSGTKLFTPEDTTDPILSNLTGTNPCERRGPLSVGYWTAAGQTLWRSLFGSPAPTLSEPIGK